jgi:Arc/MetJ-type ribon-helix-helix transcriptional regulator
MRTHRLTLLVTKAEKERIAREAAVLGTSESDYVRKAVTLLDAEDVAALENLPSLLPEFNAALTRIHDTLAAAAKRSERHRQEMARMRTPEYREEVRRSIEKDRAGLDAVAPLFGGAPAKSSASEVQPPMGGTGHERTTKTGSAGTGVREHSRD